MPDTRFCRLKYDLHQQTAYIHFEVETRGAADVSPMGVTLRATEVKPKLDRFLLHHEPALSFPGKHLLPLQEESDRKALNYALRFHAPASGYKIIDPGEKNSGYELFFFANMPQRNQIKRTPRKDAICFKGPVGMEIISWNPLLTDALRKWIPAFFATHNFGMRQTKGFGSFWATEEGRKAKFGDLNRIDGIIAQAYSERFYAIRFRDTTDDVSIRKHMAFLYSVMKSGYNFGGEYIRSFLFRYMHRCFSCQTAYPRSNIGNEKAYIKGHLWPLPLTGMNARGEHVRFAPMPKSQYRYVRALLGATENIAFRDIDRHGPGGPNDQANVQIKGEHVQRFASPVLLKFIHKTVYLLPGPMNGIFDQPFTFTAPVLENPTDVLYTPSKEDFDLIDFLDHFTCFYNNDDAVKAHNRYMSAFPMEIMGSRPNSVADTPKGGTP